ncbi:unnamed protein product [Citrullus colocynthis]|uniref:Uncharacterized protein n=1 Tax=Citrullus colocynthis TaxID=252529 RepID=A0ABP0Y860_9ROSI
MVTTLYNKKEEKILRNFLAGLSLTRAVAKTVKIVTLNPSFIEKPLKSRQLPYPPPRASGVRYPTRWVEGRDVAVVTGQRRDENAGSILQKYA